MGVRTPETCWAVHKRQVINWRHCCIWLVDLFESEWELEYSQILLQPKSRFYFSKIAPFVAFDGFRLWKCLVTTVLYEFEWLDIHIFVSLSSLHYMQPQPAKCTFDCTYLATMANYDKLQLLWPRLRSILLLRKQHPHWEIKEASCN